MKKDINWVPLSGKSKITKGNIEYIHSVVAEGPGMGQLEFCLVKSNIWFESGSISFDATVRDPQSKVQVVLNHGKPPELFAGLGAGSAYGIISYNNNKFESLSHAGGINLIPQKYSVEVKVTGSRINLFINGVSVCSTVSNISKCQPAFYIIGNDDIKIDNIKIISSPIQAFVVMQFTPEFNDLYIEVIKPTVEGFGIECIRADDIYNSGLILDDITQSIIESSLVVADITPDNPNVFYEVGYSHAIKKPVILLSDSRRDRLPFDVSGFRVIIYDNSIGGKSKIEERLRKHIDSLLNS